MSPSNFEEGECVESEGNLLCEAKDGKKSMMCSEEENMCCFDDTED